MRAQAGKDGVPGKSRLQQARDLPSRFAVGLSDYGLYGPQRRIPGEREGLLPVRPIRSWTAQIVITPHYSPYTGLVWFIQCTQVEKEILHEILNKFYL